MDLPRVTLDELMKEHTHFKVLLQRCEGLDNAIRVQVYKDLLDMEMKIISATMRIDTQR